MVPKDIAEKREVTSIKVRPTLWKRAKIEAIQRDVDLSDLVEQALEQYIDGEARKRVAKGEKTIG